MLLLDISSMVFDLRFWLQDHCRGDVAHWPVFTSKLCVLTIDLASNVSSPSEFFVLSRLDTHVSRQWRLAESGNQKILLKLWPIGLHFR